MSAFEVAACGLLAALFPCCWVILRGRFLDALVAMNLASTIGPIVLLALSMATHRQAFADLAIVAAVVAVAGSLIFARYLERIGPGGERAEKGRG